MRRSNMFLRLLCTVIALHFLQPLETYGATDFCLEERLGEKSEERPENKSLESQIILSAKALKSAKDQGLYCSSEKTHEICFYTDQEVTDSLKIPHTVRVNYYLVDKLRPPMIALQVLIIDLDSEIKILFNGTERNYRHPTVPPILVQLLQNKPSFVENEICPNGVLSDLWVTWTKNSRPPALPHKITLVLPENLDDLNDSQEVKSPRKPIRKKPVIPPLCRIMSNEEDEDTSPILSIEEDEEDNNLKQRSVSVSQPIGKARSAEVRARGDSVITATVEPISRSKSEGDRITSSNNDVTKVSSNFSSKVNSNVNLSDDLMRNRRPEIACSKLKKFLSYKNKKGATEKSQKEQEKKSQKKEDHHTTGTTSPYLSPVVNRKSNASSRKQSDPVRKPDDLKKPGKSFSLEGKGERNLAKFLKDMTEQKNKEKKGKQDNSKKTRQTATSSARSSSIISPPRSTWVDNWDYYNSWKQSKVDSIPVLGKESENYDPRIITTSLKIFGNLPVIDDVRKFFDITIPITSPEHERRSIKVYFRRLKPYESCWYLSVDPKADAKVCINYEQGEKRAINYSLQNPTQATIISFDRQGQLQYSFNKVLSINWPPSLNSSEDNNSQDIRLMFDIDGKKNITNLGNTFSLGVIYNSDNYS